VDERLGLEGHLAIAIAAERAGFQRIVVGEVAGPPALSILTMLALRTKAIRLGSGILPVYVHHPVAAAIAFSSLCGIADGRVFAGFGVSTPAMISGWFGLQRTRPVAYMREYIALFRASISGRPTEFEGQYFRSTGFRTHKAAQIPVYVGAMGSRMLAFAGEAADGVLLGLVPPSLIESRLKLVRRPGNSPEVDVSGVRIYFGSYEVEARARLARTLAAYAAMPTHELAFRQLGAVSSSSPLELNDAAIDEFCVVGSQPALRSRIDSYAAAGINCVYLQPSGRYAGDVDGCVSTVLAAGQSLFGS
jgi:alkanesulfonate monooxygenase SsuD/methylene tetrahydromethanopterin reductase-like flavin-dependent oxidoreductase (luciferase family)